MVSHSRTQFTRLSAITPRRPAYASRWSKRGEEVPEGAYLELAEQLSGGIYQLTAYKGKTISGERFLLMAKWTG
ncbi:MAG: hypothetical protein ACLS4Z_02420 [Christensenellaceae bacterium]